jgi:hypothetical protein
MTRLRSDRIKNRAAAAIDRPPDDLRVDAFG